MYLGKNKKTTIEAPIRIDNLLLHYIFFESCYLTREFQYEDLTSCHVFIGNKIKIKCNKIHERERNKGDSGVITLFVQEVRTSIRTIHHFPFSFFS